MEEKRIESIEQYVKIISECNLNNKRNGGSHNEKLFFRGHNNKDYKLLPSIARNRISPVSVSIMNHERNLLEMAKIKMPNLFNNQMSPLELLATAQHYGIPTRLLDITENALVALFFACKNTENDGEVIVFKNNETDIATYPIIQAIADSYRFTYATQMPLSDFVKAVTAMPYFDEQRTDLINLQDDVKWLMECCNDIMFTHAPIITIRQRMQQGSYILFPNNIRIIKSFRGIKEPCFEKIIKEIPKDDECIIMRIIIPTYEKEQILKNLALFGVSEGTMFNDNIDIQCKEIVKMFYQEIM